jgi:hypothetical protein
MTRPVTSLPLGAGIFAMMPSSKALSSGWTASFDFHVRVAKVYFYYVSAAIFYINRELLWATGGSKRFI